MEKSLYKMPIDFFSETWYNRRFGAGAVASAPPSILHKSFPLFCAGCTNSKLLKIFVQLAQLYILPKNVKNFCIKYTIVQVAQNIRGGFCIFYTIVQNIQKFLISLFKIYNCAILLKKFPSFDYFVKRGTFDYFD